MGIISWRSVAEPRLMLAWACSVAARGTSPRTIKAGTIDRFEFMTQPAVDVAKFIDSSDAQSGLELLSIKEGRNGHRVVFSPDGHKLANRVGGAIKNYETTPLPEKVF